MRALLIEWNTKTGIRAGNVNPRDPKLQCYGWQDLESKPALEIRLVEDDRSLNGYANVDGVTILEGKEAINAAITKYIPCKCAVKDSTLMVAAAQEAGVKLSEFAGKTPQEVARMAFDFGLAGVTERRPDLID